MAVHILPYKNSEAELTEETELLRYVPFARFLPLLRGELSFTPMHLLRSSNDPMECRPITDPAVVMTMLKDAPNSDAALLELKQLIPRWAQEVSADSGVTPETRTNHFSEAFHEFLVRRRAASCWFANPFESSAMWSSFASQGVAIKTNIGSLLHSLPVDREFVFAEVRYRARDRLHIGPGNYAQFPQLALRPFLLKGREFEHECEVRIVTKCHADQKWFFVPIHRPQTLMKEVIISPYLDTHSGRATKELIEGLLLQNFGRDHGVSVRFSKINEVIYEEDSTDIAINHLSGRNVPAADHLPL